MSEARGRIHLAGTRPGLEVSRRNFIKTAAWAGAALAAAGIGGIGWATRYAGAQEGGEPFETYQGLGDAAILQFAYQLELLEGTFYQMGADMGVVSGDALAQIQAIRDHEFAHADALAATLQQLGAEVPATPDFTYPDGVFEDTAAFLDLANTFEPVGIGAYQGAAPALESKEILGAALSIHNSECEHWNGIKILLGIDPPNNVAFEEALPLPQVQEAVAPFGVG
ncbi:ferritin-like domain-containing protein [Rubrobacter taiwanensis]|jgi:hypothetical protein|nr:ferritin-like domain-containing protein [Rubrobacter taiwanensis]